MHVIEHLLSIHQKDGVDVGFPLNAIYSSLLVQILPTKSGDVSVNCRHYTMPMLIEWTTSREQLELPTGYKLVKEDTNCMSENSFHLSQVMYSLIPS